MTLLHPVLRLIRSRLESASRPNSRTDGHRLALVIEGGGMRGIVSAGMVAALEYLGVRPTLDAVYGTSAGAINGAYFVANQAAYGTTIYYENINNSHFLDLKRLLTRQPIMSLEFLLDHVARKEKVLDTERIMLSDVPLYAVASSISQYKSAALSGFSSSGDVIEALRASAHSPCSRRTVHYGDDDYLDGSLFESIPYESAIRGGCTHLMVLLTRPEGAPATAPRFPIGYLTRRYLRHIRPELADAFDTRCRTYADKLQPLYRDSRDSQAMPSIMVIKPSSPQISRFEKVRSRLVQGAITGMQAIYQAFGYCDVDLVEALTPFDHRGHRHA